jgi:hypothetical protein
MNSRLDQIWHTTAYETRMRALPRRPLRSADLSRGHEMLCPFTQSRSRERSQHSGDGAHQPRLNQRPRKTLGFQTPASKLRETVAATH